MAAFDHRSRTFTVYFNSLMMHRTFSSVPKPTFLTLLASGQSHFCLTFSCLYDVFLDYIMVELTTGQRNIRTNHARSCCTSPSPSSLICSSLRYRLNLQAKINMISILRQNPLFPLSPPPARVL